MKNKISKFVGLIFLSVALLAGCGGESDTSSSPSSSSSSSIPDVSGTYDQTYISSICSDYFDTTIEVVQNGSNIILQGTSEGYIDASGTIDANGEFTVNGEFGDGTDYVCEGSIISDIALATCDVGSFDCYADYEKR